MPMAAAALSERTVPPTLIESTARAWIGVLEKRFVQAYHDNRPFGDAHDSAGCIRATGAFWFAAASQRGGKGWGLDIG